MFNIGPWEMVIAGMIALLLFGKRLPEVARSLGKGIIEFKKGMQGIEEDVRRPSAQQQSRPYPTEEREEPSAPRFEPPKFEPSEAPSQKV